MNYDVIDKYAKYLKSNQIHGALVNGTTGEGMTMSKDERKKMAETWRAACSKHSLTFMIQIGGAPIADVIDLANHAEEIGADAVLCLPELYFKPQTEEQLVKYVSRIAEFCPKTPFLYYHIPRNTKTDCKFKTPKINVLKTKFLRKNKY